MRMLLTRIREFTVFAVYLQRQARHARARTYTRARTRTCTPHTHTHTLTPTRTRANSLYISTFSSGRSFLSAHTCIQTHMHIQILIPILYVYTHKHTHKHHRTCTHNSIIAFVLEFQTCQKKQEIHTRIVCYSRSICHIFSRAYKQAHTRTGIPPHI